MSDILTAEQRRTCMSHVKSKNTRPELLVRRYLFSKGFRFRLHRKDLPGKPDIVLPKYKTVIFINGCFWHGHECKYASIPETNRIFWALKIQDNVNRDIVTQKKLSELGWKVITIWQCQLKPKTKDSTLENLISEIRNEQ